MQTQVSKKQEASMFLFLTVLLFPILSVGFIGGYGFIVWMIQLLTGAPGGH